MVGPHFLRHFACKFWAKLALSHNSCPISPHFILAWFDLNHSKYELAQNLLRIVLQLNNSFAEARQVMIHIKIETISWKYFKFSESAFQHYSTLNLDKDLIRKMIKLAIDKLLMSFIFYQNCFKKIIFNFDPCLPSWTAPSLPPFWLWQLLHWVGQPSLC